MLITSFFASRLDIRGLPQLEKVPYVDPGEDDTLIMCAGFEQRSLHSLSLVNLDSKFDLFAVRYIPDVPENQALGIERLLVNRAAVLHWFVYDRENPEGTPYSIVQRIISSGKGGRVYLDISGMSRLMIVQFIAALSESMLIKRAIVVYVEAVSYDPDQGEVLRLLASAQERGEEDKFFSLVSAGVFGLTVVPELSSVAMLGQPIHLVFFPTWNTMQFAATVAEVQASSLSVVLPRSVETGLTWMSDAMQSLSRLDPRMAADEDVHHCSVHDYAETIATLGKVYDKFGLLHRLLISPTGSKMQTVGVGIFKVFFNDAQIVYPTPKTFTSPGRYSRGVKQMWALDLASLPDIGEHNRL